MDTGAHRYGTSDSGIQCAAGNDFGYYVSAHPVARSRGRPDRVHQANQAANQLAALRLEGFGARWRQKAESPGEIAQISNFCSGTCGDVQEIEIFAVASARTSFNDVRCGGYGRAPDLRLQSVALFRWEGLRCLIKIQDERVCEFEDAERAVISSHVRDQSNTNARCRRNAPMNVL